MLTPDVIKKYYDVVKSNNDIVGFGRLFALGVKLSENPLKEVDDSFNKNIEAYLLQRFSGLKNARTVYEFEQQLIATQEMSWVLDATLKLIAYYYENQMLPVSTANRRLMKELEDFALSEARYRGVYLDSFYREWGIPVDKQTFSAYTL